MSNPISAYIDGISLIGPGLSNWHDSREILTENSIFEMQPTIIPAPMLLPPAERRRSGDLVKLTLAVGLQAAQSANINPASLACVYTSSSGDGKNCHEICKTLASEDRQISPTRFHNSVHNAPAGYWSIATGAKTPISVLCAYDASFGAGLLESVTQVVADHIPTILIAVDATYPDPLNHVRPIPDALGIGLVLSPIKNTNTIAQLELHLCDAPVDQFTHQELETIRSTIPAARGLPLLKALAKNQAETVILDYLQHQRISVTLTPCK